ncbi:glycosyltransferase WbuB [Pseudomonas fluorescens]|uniref:Colanic acid biosynthesis glycosyltransferase WcaI n=1 Tax=Pseudomonas fluorescens TaxID=294 RepID=A0A7Z6QQD7_PSEFL|nr:glycosyltransferase WbuB [Pseudomonas fluorescens]RDS88532.1 colanic acid biosynthesis glycosyltransferase WcaI [Pseudomonas fluorescens]
MKILLYGINYSPELTGIGKYSGEQARWLAGQGHEVRVVTAPPYYPQWQVGEGYSPWRFRTEQDDGVTVIRCPLYVPRQPTALTRLLHLMSFSASSFLAVMGQWRWKPDLVILVVPTLFCAPQALLLAKLSGARSVLHIQDYEVDAMFGLGIGGGSLVRRLAFGLERWLLRRFDRVSTISSGMLDKARGKGVSGKRLLFFPNWSETARFRQVPRSPGLLQRLGVASGQRVLLYAGNIGEKQGLELILDAAQAYADRPELVFLIVGQGTGKIRLLERVQRDGLRNVLFAPLQPYEDLPVLLASADVHLVIQKRGVADAVLPSKLTNILAVGGHAIITADPGTTLGRLCEEHPGIAVLAEPESVAALNIGIERALALPARNEVALNYAKEFLDKERILQRFMAQV